LTRAAILEVAFPHGTANAKELQIVSALHHPAGLLGQVFRQGEGKIVGLLVFDRACVGAGFDLVKQHAAASAELGGSAEVIKAGGGGFDLLELLDVMAPGDVGEQFLNSLFKNWRMRRTGLGRFCDGLLQKSAAGHFQFRDSFGRKLSASLR